MVKILSAQASQVFGRGTFRIRRVRPGLAGGVQLQDPVIGPLSAVDHANLAVGTVVAMHEHRNDEILSYMWQGIMVHEDSSGQRVELSPRRLMMMNAGRSFFHEESTPDVPVEALQIFIRPEADDLEPSVQFYERPEGFENGQWNLIGGPAGSNAPLLIRNRVTVYDAHPKAGAELILPTIQGLQQWVYVMDGMVTVGDHTLSKGDSVTDPDMPLPALRADSDATVVVFLIDPQAPASLAGTISGYGV